MDVTQFLGMFQASSPDELQKIFEGFRNRLRVISTAVQAYESARVADRKELLPERVLAIKKEIDIVEWASLSKISDSLPTEARIRFSEFRREYEGAIASLGELTTSVDFPAANDIRTRIANLSSQLDDFEGRSTRASSQRRWMIAGASICLLIVGPIFMFFQYWSGDIEADSFTLIFPSATHGRHSVIAATKFASEPQGFSVPERDEFMTEFTRFYFCHPNNFLDQNYERPFPEMTAPTSPEVQHSLGPGKTAPMAAPMPPAEKAPSAADPAAQAESAPPGNSALPAGSDQEMAALPVAPDLKKESVAPNVALNWEKMQKERAYRWKILLQNTSLRSPIYVSSVRETIELVREEPFPWAELRYAPVPKLRCVNGHELFQPPSMEFINEGLGPIIEMDWRITTTKDVLVSKGTQFFIGGRRVGGTPLVIAREREWGLIRLQKQGTSPRDEVLLLDGTPIYRLIEKWPAGISDSEIETVQKSDWLPKTDKPFVKNGDRYLERVRSVKELNKIAETLGSIRVELTYEDLKGDKKKLREEVRLPDGVLIFKWNEKLFPVYSDSAGAARAFFFALANAHSPLPANQTDKSVLVTNVDFDLSNLLPAARVTVATQFDTNLSPLGHIAIFTKARCIRNGTYDITVDVDGSEAMKVRLKALNPELRTFPVPQMTTLSLDEASTLRDQRWFEINWFRWRIGTGAKSGLYTLPQKTRNTLTVYPLDNVEGSAWFDPRIEHPFDSAPSGTSAPSAPEPPIATPAPPVGPAPEPPKE